MSLEGKTALSSINVGFAVAYELSEKINLGAGIDVIYGEGEISRQGLLGVDADGFGLGANIGATYQVNENNKFGISYRYSPDIEVEGDIWMLGSGTAEKMNVPSTRHTRVFRLAPAQRTVGFPLQLAVGELV